MGDRNVKKILMNAQEWSFQFAQFIANLVYLIVPFVQIELTKAR